jgi:hypothetical protein
MDYLDGLRRALGVDDDHETLRAAFREWIERPDCGDPGRSFDSARAVWGAPQPS